MSIFAELKRRNIFRVALLYIVAGWLVLEVLSFCASQLGIPAWIFRFIFALLLICFPLLLAFSWMFEITPDGLKREHTIQAQASITAMTGSKITKIALILLVIATLIAGVNSLMSNSKPGEPQMNWISMDKHTQDDASSITSNRRQIDLQGHRGARGLMPENTIPAFLLALDLGVTTLEMDVVINAEKHVVVSHEPWMSAKICSHADGRHVSKEEEKTLRIYAMSDAELATFDCGSRGHPGHPNQQTMSVSKPLLSELFNAVARHVDETGHDARFGEVMFNIEIKSLPEGDHIFHPGVIEFASLLIQVVSEHRLLDRTSIQSFDTRALEAVNEINPQIATVFLIDNPLGLQENLKHLSFTPSIYSPDHQLLNQEEIDAAHALDMRVIPWTVNDKETMRELIRLGVDGLITDYPDLGMQLVAELLQSQ